MYVILLGNFEENPDEMEWNGRQRITVAATPYGYDLMHVPKPHGWE